MHVIEALGVGGERVHGARRRVRAVRVDTVLTKRQKVSYVTVFALFV